MPKNKRPSAKDYRHTEFHESQAYDARFQALQWALMNRSMDNAEVERVLAHAEQYHEFLSGAPIGKIARLLEDIFGEDAKDPQETTEEVVDTDEFYDEKSEVREGGGPVPADLPADPANSEYQTRLRVAFVDGQRTAYANLLDFKSRHGLSSDDTIRVGDIEDTVTGLIEQAKYPEGV